jgi:hypothetical protein
MVAIVILPDGTNLNREMVERGMAWHYRKFAPEDVFLIRAQVCAKKVEAGLWSQPNPIPPWDWRKGEAASKPGVTANRRSKIYHAPHSRAASRISARNYVPFTTAKEAEAAGYRKAGDCP